jgi:hypothetical protein
MRWLGFMQGVLFSLKYYSLEELKQHSRERRVHPPANANAMKVFTNDVFARVRYFGETTTRELDQRFKLLVAINELIESDTKERT